VQLRGLLPLEHSEPSHGAACSSSTSLPSTVSQTNGRHDGAVKFVGAIFGMTLAFAAANQVGPDGADACATYSKTALASSLILIVILPQPCC